MLRATRWLLAGALFASLGPFVYQQGRALWWAGGPDPALFLWGSLGLAPGLVAVALVGRTALSLLPPGEPGSHRPGALGATWAASHFLGLVVLEVELRLLGVLGLPQAPLFVLGPWALVLAGRLATLPGAPRPRRRTASERAPRWAGALQLAPVAAAFLPLLLWASPVVRVKSPAAAHQTSTFLEGLAPAGLPGPLPPLAAFSWPCLLVLLAFGLRGGRRAPVGRRLVLLGMALLPFAVMAVRRQAAVTELPLYFGAGCSFLVTWLRRADRRAACLSALGFAACGLVSPAGLLLGLCGLFGLWLATPTAVSKIFAAGLAGISLAAVAAPAVLSGELFGFAREFVWDVSSALTRSPARTGYWTLRELVDTGRDTTQWGLVWFLVPAAALLALVLRALRGRAERESGIDPPGRELLALGVTGVLALVLFVVLAAWVQSPSAAPWIGGEDSSVALLTLAPTALLFVGLALVRPEDPHGRRGGAALE